MKKGILVILLGALTIGANAQSLKEALYGGKLRNDSNSVIKKGDDLSTKIDTTTKAKAAEAVKPKVIGATGDSVQLAHSNVTDSSVSETNDIVPVANAAIEKKPAGPDHRNNNKVLKAYIDSLTASLKAEVLSSKKIKKGTYYFYLDYEIGEDGTIGINNLTVTPENETLGNQVKDRLIMTAPQLAPVPDSSGKPRKVKRKYNFNVTKD